jgi:hypothetical protein
MMHALRVDARNRARNDHPHGVRTAHEKTPARRTLPGYPRYAAFSTADSAAGNMELDLSVRSGASEL